MLDFYNLDKATIEKVAEDILSTKYIRDGIIEEKDAIEIDQTHHYMAQGREVFTLVDMTDGEIKLSAKANEYFSKKAKMIPNIKAVGLIMGNFTSKMKQKFQLQLYKPLYPTKIFNTREEALAWFDELREADN
ncbi:hypothetical protein JYT74_01330 [Crocinitomix catalasitica]|nr:hypothetical protein [Crocinitomix catalasitica]